MSNEIKEACKTAILHAHKEDSASVPIVTESKILQNKDPYLPEPLAYLENKKIWVCFDLTPQSDGSMKKLPINPHTGLQAKSNDPSTWGTFKEAKDALMNLTNDRSAQYKPRFLGFALIPEINLVFIDLDHVIETEVLSQQALEIVEKIDSYVEYSQSRTGLHIYAKGRKSTHACKKGFLEVYDHDRLVCITNSPYGEVRLLREASIEVAEICAQYLPTSAHSEQISQKEAVSLCLDDQEILTKASAAKNGAKFKRLYYDGDICEYGDDESAADQALMNLLAFYTRDNNQLEQLFSQSALGQRSKWVKRQDYRKRTIKTALACVRETYKSSPRSSSTRPEIIISQGDLHLATDAAEEILLSSEGIYQRGGRLVRVVSAATKPLNKAIDRSENAYIITDVTLPCLTELLTKKAFWMTLKDKGGKKQVDCPDKVSKTLLARAEWKLPVLRGIIHAPTLRSDGSLLFKPGYDLSTGLLFLDGGIKWEAIPEQPSREQALEAFQELSELLQGFPFANKESKSVALAGILTALIRKSITTAPMFGITAPKMGSGKSLLADVIALIATGKSNSVLSAADNEIEERKRLLSVLMEGDLMICYDNIEQPFGSPSLCSVLTQKEFKDRVLGSSATATVPTDVCFLATGNNLTIIGDLSTRTMLCQLDPVVERPEERSFTTNLHHYIPENRPRLVKAGLLILRAYHVAGRPKQDIKQFGRFEEWSDWVRSAIVWLGLHDPCLTRQEIESADPIRIALGALFAAWHSIFGSVPTKVKDLVRKARDAQVSSEALQEALLSLVGTAKGEINERWLGNKLKSFKNRIEQGYRLESTGEHQGTTLWRITQVSDRSISIGGCGGSGGCSTIPITEK